MIRRLLTVCVLIWVPLMPGIQIGILMWTCTFWSGYALHYKPFASKNRIYQEVFNNSCFYVLLSICFQFTPFYTEEAVRLALGRMFNYVFYAMLALNISMQIFDTIKSLIKKCRGCYYKKRNQRIVDRLLAQRLEQKEKAIEKLNDCQQNVL